MERFYLDDVLFSGVLGNVTVEEIVITVDFLAPKAGVELLDHPLFSTTPPACSFTCHQMIAIHGDYMDETKFPLWNFSKPLNMIWAWQKFAVYRHRRYI